MKFVIKNMVCNRCIQAVEAGVRNIGLHPIEVGLGELIIQESELSEEQLGKLDSVLHELGFQRTASSRQRMVERIKKLVIEQIHQSNPDLKVTWSDYLSSELHVEYSYLSALFSKEEGITLEQFIIRQKIEKVKELLVYDESTLDQIAWQLGYNSSAYLNNQFKKITGMTPGKFKKMGASMRKPLDEV